MPSKDSELGNLKIGDEVFVVWQRSRQEERENKEHRTKIVTIVKVGSKYAYFQDGSWLKPFCKRTGVSVHNTNDNSRMNGQGFDVYKTKQEWERYQYEVELQKRFEQRIKSNYWGFIHLPCDALEKIHAILDEVEKQT